MERDRELGAAWRNRGREEAKWRCIAETVGNVGGIATQTKTRHVAFTVPLGFAQTEKKNKSATATPPNAMRLQLLYVDVVVVVVIFLPYLSLCVCVCVSLNTTAIFAFFLLLFLFRLSYGFSPSLSAFIKCLSWFLFLIFLSGQIFFRIFEDEKKKSFVFGISIDWFTFLLVVFPFVH